jgi:hypothetical protein
LPGEFFKLHVPHNLANHYSSFRLFNLFKRRSYDIVHSHFGPSGILGIGLKQQGMPGKYITTFHAYDVNSYPKTEGKDIYKDLFRYGDLFIAVTNFTKQRLVELGATWRR